MTAEIIAGFPGAGKSALRARHSDARIIDLDPSPYRESREWPREYIADIDDAIRRYEYVLISTHPEVIGILLELGHTVILVYPDLSQQDEYHRRYVARGNSPRGVELLTSRFSVNVLNLQAVVHPNCTHVVLRPGQYLADVISL